MTEDFCLEDKGIRLGNEKGDTIIFDYSDIKKALKLFKERNFYYDDGELRSSWVENYDWTKSFKEIFGGLAE